MAHSGWNESRWNGLSGPDSAALKDVFRSLDDFLRNPSFPDGFDLGKGTPPTYNAGTNVKSEAALTPVNSDTILARLASVDATQPGLSGNVNGTDTQLLFQGGVTLTTVLAADYHRIVLPAAFPTGLLSFTAQVQSTVSGYMVNPTNGSSDRTKLEFRAWEDDGVKKVTALSVYWTAFGW